MRNVSNILRDKHTTYWTNSNVIFYSRFVFRKYNRRLIWSRKMNLVVYCLSNELQARENSSASKWVFSTTFKGVWIHLWIYCACLNTGKSMRVSNSGCQLSKWKFRQKIHEIKQNRQWERWNTKALFIFMLRYSYILWMLLMTRLALKMNYSSVFIAFRMNCKCEKTRVYTSGSPRAHCLGLETHEARPIRILSWINGLPKSPRQIPRPGGLLVHKVFSWTRLPRLPKRIMHSERGSMAVFLNSKLFDK